MIRKPENALHYAIRIKASLKSNENIDVRMAIGIGDITYNAHKVTESNGSAFVFSGEKFERNNFITLILSLV